MSSRRNFLRNTAMVSALGLSRPVLGNTAPAGTHNSGNDDDPPSTIGHGAFRYKVDKSWAKINIDNTPLINCHEMVQDSRKRLIMLGDSIHNNILVFDKSGKLLDHWGTAFPGAHGLTLSQEGGEDFLFITDSGWYKDKEGVSHRQAGQVVKTTVGGVLVFAIGHPRTIGIYKDDEPFMPTETAIAPNGDIYVADGYGSDYIIQYNHKGQYIRHFGGRNNANPDHNLINAHGVAVDTRNPGKPELICTSREENCFKVFTLDGKFLRRIDTPGMYVCRPVLHKDNLYAGVCWSKNQDGKREGHSGFITILDKQNKVVSNPGGSEPLYRNGKLQPVIQSPAKVFSHGHDVCIDDEENVYVCQWNAYQTPPVKLTRV